MAKGTGKKKANDNGTAAVVVATEAPDVPTPRVEPVIEVEPVIDTAPPQREVALPATAPRPAWSATGLVDEVGEFGAASVRALRSVLPTRRTPLVLLGAGLLVVGLVDPPVVVGAGLAYEALRRWQPSPVAAR